MRRITTERLAEIRAALTHWQVTAEVARNDNARMQADICDLLAAHDALTAELTLIRGAMAADAERLLAASERIGMVPMGCDTADHMADVILLLRAARQK